MPKLRLIQGGLEASRWVTKLGKSVDVLTLPFLKFVAEDELGDEWIEVRRTNRDEALLIAPSGAKAGFFARLFIAAKMEVPQEALLTPRQIELVTSWTEKSIVA